MNRLSAAIRKAVERAKPTKSPAEYLNEGASYLSSTQWSKSLDPSVWMWTDRFSGVSTITTVGCGMISFLGAVSGFKREMAVFTEEVKELDELKEELMAVGFQMESMAAGIDLLVKYLIPPIIINKSPGSSNYQQMPSIAKAVYFNNRSFKDLDWYKEHAQAFAVYRGEILEASTSADVKVEPSNVSTVSKVSTEAALAEDKKPPAAK